MVSGFLSYILHEQVEHLGIAPHITIVGGGCHLLLGALYIYCAGKQNAFVVPSDASDEHKRK